MGLGGSLLLIAVGAILTFALNVTVSGIDLDIVGVILMITGASWLVLSLVLWQSRRTAGRGPAGLVEERRVYEERPVVRDPTLEDPLL